MTIGELITSRRLRITVEGDAAAEGRIALAELARIAGEVQAQVERIALVLTAGSSTGPGRRPGEVVDATQLDLVGFTAGSAVLEVEAHSRQARLFDEDPELVDRSLDRLVAGIREITANPQDLPEGFDRGVVSGLVDLSGSVGSRISMIELALGDTEPIVINEVTKAAVREARSRLEQEPITVVGRLHMGDFAPSALRCRIDTADGPITCDFDEELRPAVLEAMDQIVEAEGLAEYWAGEDRPRFVHVSSIQVVAEAEERSVDELVRAQGVQPVMDTRELACPPIDDFDEFLAAVQTARGR